MPQDLFQKVTVSLYSVLDSDYSKPLLLHYRRIFSSSASNFFPLLFKCYLHECQATTILLTICFASVAIASISSNHGIITGDLRSVEYQSVPLAFNVVILWLLSDIDSIKLQLSGQFLLPLEDNQRDLKIQTATKCIRGQLAWNLFCSSSISRSKALHSKLHIP